MRRLNNILRIAVLLAAALPAFGGEPVNTATGPAGLPAAMSPDVRTQFWFGVAVENIPPNIALQLKLKPSQGLMIAAVLPNSPAEKVGLKRDDLLIAINGRPLTSQDELFRAANPREKNKAGTEAAAKATTLTYLRAGDRFDVDIIPEQRPASMISFVTPGANNSHGITTYVTPSGGGAEVGPGYRINLSGNDSGDFTANSIKQIVSKGQTVILSQDTDVAGNVKNTITEGATVYTVDPNHLELLPEDLRPLAKQLIDGTPAAVTTGPAKTAPAVDLELRVKELERQNAELMKRVDEMMKREQGNK